MARERRPEILVVEDEPVLRRALVRFLRTEGCVVREAADGEEALHALRVTPVDAVVCDVTMPRLDGVRLWDAARKDAHLADIPFIFVSALPFSRLATPGMRYLPKPYLLEEVWRELQGVLDDR